MDLWDKMMDPVTLSQRMWQWDGSAFSMRTYADIVADARHVAAGLQAHGVAPGDIVAAVITNGPDAISGVLGAWFAGARLASLPIIARGMSIPSYVAQLARLCHHLGPTCLLAEERFLAFMDSDMDLGAPVLGYRALVETLTVGEVSFPSLDDAIFIQFSSGTTGEPRGVQLSGVAIDTHMAMLSQHTAIDPERDIGYTWLPLSHDMGLFGCGLLAWYTGMAGVIAAPERFLTSPRTWFDDCSEFGVTVTAGPPFALDVAARAEKVRPGSSLVHLRLCLVGAEQIMWETLINTTRIFAPRGLTMEALTPAYGLAEATLAVTVDSLDCKPSFLIVDGTALAEGRLCEVDAEHPNARRLVSAGKPLPGVDVRIDPIGSEIVVRSPCLASGYFDNAHLTEKLFRRNEFHTGDVGLLDRGKLYISGRCDDLLIVAGRNIYVQELERSLGKYPDIRQGNCAIVDVLGTAGGQTTMVAEINADRIDSERLAGHLRRTAMEQGGLLIDHFVFLPRDSFPKTPSGKVQRYRCREIALDAKIGTRVRFGASQGKRDMVV